MSEIHKQCDCYNAQTKGGCDVGEILSSLMQKVKSPAGAQALRSALEHIDSTSRCHR